MAEFKFSEIIRSPGKPGWLSVQVKGTTPTREKKGRSAAAVDPDWVKIQVSRY